MTGMSPKQVQAIARAYRRANSVSRILPPTLGNDWAQKNFIISPEAKGATTGPWVSRPWQIEVLNLFSSTEIEEVSWRKSSRMGASKMVCCAIAQALEERKYNTILYQPHDESSDKFVKSEIDPMFRDVPALRKIMLKNSKKYNTMNFKQVRGAILHCLGGTASANYRSRSADLVVIDECSEFPLDINNQGDSRGLARTRLTESPFKKQINISSPTIDGFCLITQALGEMDYVFKYYVPCPDCGALQYMDFHEDREDMGVIWDFKKTELSVRKASSTARYKCIHCQHESSYQEMTKAQIGGKWQTEDGRLWLQGGRINSSHGFVTGQRWHVGLDSNTLISPSFTFQNFVSEYLKAKARYEEGNDGPMKTFRNNREGKVWKPQDGIKSLDFAIISDLAESFPDQGMAPAPVQLITSAADIQGNRIEVGTVGHGYREESWYLDYQVFPGDTTKHEVWQRLEDYWLEKFWWTEDGRELPIYLHGIDHGGHWASTVELFCRENGPREFIPLKGRLGEGKAYVDYPRLPNKTSGVWLTHINTDPVKQLVQKRLSYSMGGFDEDFEIHPGRIHTPEPTDGYELFTDEFYKQLTSETRQLLPSGKPLWKVSGKNEAFDITCMNTALCKLAQLPAYGFKFQETELSQMIPPPVKKSGKYDFKKLGGVNRPR